MTTFSPKPKFGSRAAAEQEASNLPVADLGALRAVPVYAAPRQFHGPDVSADSPGKYLELPRSAEAVAPTSASYTCQRPQTHGHEEAAPKRAFTTNEAGNYIGRSSSWMRKKRLRGAGDMSDPGPKYVETPSGTVMYLREDLDAYLDGLVARAEQAGGGK
jgi:hypothetical protein